MLIALLSKSPALDREARKVLINLKFAICLIIIQNMKNGNWTSIIRLSLNRFEKKTQKNLTAEIPSNLSVKNADFECEQLKSLFLQFHLFHELEFNKLESHCFDFMSFTLFTWRDGEIISVKGSQIGIRNWWPDDFDMIFFFYVFFIRLLS